jgi:sulfur relay (sulfurtransferase) complex TusBCD TusD component (DsrE family)
VRRGCISLGNVKCDLCLRTILYPERYLSVEESNNKNLTVCMDCCQEKGWVKKELDKEKADSYFNLSTD